jgi:RNA 2',3'-cyclic 3'-phosphodiesterase
VRERLSLAVAPSVQRLFVALWPDPQLRGTLHDWAHGAAAEVGGRPVVPDNLHLTLLFLGPHSPELERAALALASSVPFAPFELKLDHVHFQRRSGILWAGAREVPAALARLVEALVQGAPALGVVPESRAFRAHVTLLRKARRMPRRATWAPCLWQAKDLTVVCSTLRPEGAHYRTLFRRLPDRCQGPD